MKRCIPALIALVLLSLLVIPASASSYDHTLKVKNMSFSWSVDGDILKARMSAKTKGWVAVGFNPSKKMKDANIVMGYVKDGSVKLVDHYGNRSTGHVADTKEGGSKDVTLVGGSEKNGRTTIEFTMPMNSKDKRDQVLTADGETLLLLAYGPNRDSFKPRHKFRTKLYVNLSTGASR